MTTFDRHLTRGESIIYQARATPRAALAPLFVLIGSLITLAVAAGRRDGQAAVGLAGIVGVIAALVALALLYRSLVVRFALTTQRVLVRTGLLGGELHEMPLGRMESVHVSRGLIGLLFGYGNVEVRGLGGSSVLLEAAVGPYAVRSRIQAQIGAQQEQAAAMLFGAVQAITAPAPAPARALPARPSAPAYYYATGGQTHGPVSAPQLRSLASAGRLAPDDGVWCQGMNGWARAADVQGLF